MMDPITIGAGLIALGLLRSWMKEPERIVREIDKADRERDKNRVDPKEHGW